MDCRRSLGGAGDGAGGRYGWGYYVYIRAFILRGIYGGRACGYDGEACKGVGAANSRGSYGAAHGGRGAHVECGRIRGRLEFYGAFVDGGGRAYGVRCCGWYSYSRGRRTVSHCFLFLCVYFRCF